MWDLVSGGKSLFPAYFVLLFCWLAREEVLYSNLLQHIAACVTCCTGHMVQSFMLLSRAVITRLYDSCTTHVSKHAANGSGHRCVVVEGMFMVHGLSASHPLPGME